MLKHEQVPGWADDLLRPQWVEETRVPVTLRGISTACPRLPASGADTLKL